MDEQVETAPFLYNSSVLWDLLIPFLLQFLVHSGLCKHKSFQDIRLVVFVMYIELVAIKCVHLCQANGNPLPKVSNRKRVLAARLGVCWWAGSMHSTTITICIGIPTFGISTLPAPWTSGPLLVATHRFSPHDFQGHFTKNNSEAICCWLLKMILGGFHQQLIQYSGIYWQGYNQMLVDEFVGKG